MLRTDTAACVFFASSSYFHSHIPIHHVHLPAPPALACAHRYATESKAPVISITSYNEWGEGTQIEPALSTEAAAAVKTVKNAVPVVSASKIAGGFAAAAAGTSAEGGGAGGGGANAVAVGKTEKKRGEIALTKAELQKMKVNEYTDYTQNGGEEYEPEYYLQKTLWWAMKFTGGTSSAMGSSHAGV